jgi:SAM-dependent methyltransferase
LRTNGIRALLERSSTNSRSHADGGTGLRVLRHVHEALRPGGTFIIDVLGKETLARIFEETRSAAAADGTLLVWRTAVAADWTRVRSEWHVIRDGSDRVFRVEHWIYSGRELRELLLQAGFRDVRLFGDLDGRDYGTAAARLVAVARK